jgi:outer membrane protein OmpA-like peptidoglycan-associated protein
MPHRWIFLALLALGAPAGAPAAGIDLYQVEFPERRTVALALEPLAGAPAAAIEARVTFRDGRSAIEISHQGLKPALLYGGDVTCWVLWAVSKDGSAEGLGEIGRGPKGKESFSTPRGRFALLITAESYPLAGRPSALAGFASRPAGGEASAVRFRFEDLAPAPEHGRDGVADVAWDQDSSIDLAQARRAFDIAGRRGARRHAADLFAEADAALDRAGELASGKDGGPSMVEAARRSYVLASAAIRRSIAAEEAIRAREERAESKLRLEDAEDRAAKAEGRAAGAEAEVLDLSQQVAVLQEQREAQREEIAELRGTKSLLEDEKAELRGRLRGALSQVAQTEESARGYVVSLGDILFDTNQASLKPQAEVALAKLAGILLVVVELRARVEGHTDSSGSPEHNLQLSRARAESVVAFLVGQGVAAERLEAAGFGSEHPVADNATREGRGRNRRVEIVLSGGG